MARKKRSRRERSENVDCAGPKGTGKRASARLLAEPFRSRLFQIVALTAVALIIAGFWDTLAFLHELPELVSIALFVSILYAFEFISAWANSDGDGGDSIRPGR